MIWLSFGYPIRDDSAASLQTNTTFAVIMDE